MPLRIDKENVEKALSNRVKDSLEKELGNRSSPHSQSQDQPLLSKQEEIGFHKGALNTLAAERNELIKILTNVETIMHAHLKRLEELGVKIQK